MLGTLRSEGGSVRVIAGGGGTVRDPDLRGGEC